MTTTKRKAADDDLLVIDDPSMPNGFVCVPERQDKQDAVAFVKLMERLATDPSVDVAKLERLIELQERILGRQAKIEFDLAFARMQGEIPIIVKKGQIVVNGVERSKFARNEDIQDIVKPILQKHGFSLRFRHEYPTKDSIKVIGILSHASGHTEQDEFVAPSDSSGSKNSIQAIGSTRSYGQRYTTVALLNIASTGEDNDGHGDPEQTPEDAWKPTGFNEWATDMNAIADNGMPALREAWKDEKAAAFRDFMYKHERARWEAIKAKAKKAKR